MTVAIVTYRSDLKLLADTIDSILNSPLSIKLYIIDNSPTDQIRSICSDNRIIYNHNSKNLGFGKAHNQVLKEVIYTSKYHLIINPDVQFNKNVIPKMLEYLERNQEVGLMMPKVLFPDQSIQRNCRLLPGPVQLFVRRFLLFLPSLQESLNYEYEMQFTDYETEMEVPYLSGCFMLIKTEVIKTIGCFDERFFLYLGDTDFSRRIHQQYKTIYYPEVFIYHHQTKGSYKSLKMLGYHLSSAIKYFNKWGWIDTERRKINQRIIQQRNG